ncbi:MAG: DUF6186 family protein [Microbacteriaceae bacterium]
MSAWIVTACYLAVVGAAVIIELIAWRRPQVIAPLGTMLDHVMRSRTVRLGMIAAWWWCGWHFLFADTVQLNL